MPVQPEREQRVAGTGAACSWNGSSVQPEREQRAAGTGAACSWNRSSVQPEREQRAAGTGAACSCGYTGVFVEMYRHVVSALAGGCLTSGRCCPNRPSLRH